MNASLLVDTDIMIDLLRGHEAAVAWVREHTADIALSVITVAELYAGFKVELPVVERQKASPAKRSGIVLSGGWTCKPGRMRRPPPRRPSRR